MFSPRVHLKPLALLCRRLATTTHAGLEDRRIWRDEAQRGRGTQRAAVARVSDELARGQSVAEAMATTGDYFPVLFRQMIAVGEMTGTLDRTYRRLADHYDHMLAARRALWSALAWPLLQLGLAILAIGGVIWFSAAFNLKNFDGEPLDIFGFGLTGSWGLTIYVALVMLAFIVALLFAQAVRRGVFWTRRLQRAALKAPGLGHALETLAMARFTWALQLVLDTALDLRKSLPLALDASGNDAYRQLAPRIVDSITRGMSLHMAMAETGAFPADFLDAVQVGEQSGMLAETMGREAQEYQRRAAAAIAMIARIVGGVIWVLIAALIIVLIFRVFTNYTNTLEELSKPNSLQR